MEKFIGVLAAVAIGSSQLVYLVNGWQKKITPSVLSWTGWAFLMGTSVVSQVVAKGWQWSMTGILCSSFGCVVISVAALFSGNYAFRRTDWWYLLAGLGCVGIYVASANPWVTTIFAIVADAFLGIPTIVKAFKNPASERSVAWPLAMLSSMLALSICVDHDVIYVLFPAYLWVFNAGMVGLTWRRGRGVEG
jgi:hypothetical protein